MKDTAALASTRWPANSLEAVPACPVCGSAARTVLHNGLVDNTFFVAPGTWSMQQCRDCGSAYLDPRPTPESIAEAYAAYYTHGAASASQHRRLKAAIKRVMQRFSAAYVRSLERPNPQGRRFSTMLAARVVKALAPCREVIDARYRHLSSPVSGADRLLDIGCGSGEFLLRARSLGWKVEGVDFDPKAVEAARASGLEVRVGSIEAYSDVRDAFDVVTCNHVIEHVYDPVYLIRAIHRILKLGGLLWIETPNIASAGHALFGAAWRGLESPRHIAILNYRILVRLLTEAGFSITHRTPWNIQHIRMMFTCSEAITAGGDPHNTRTPLVPNWRLLKGLWLEALFVDHREFVSLRARKR